MFAKVPRLPICVGVMVVVLLVGVVAARPSLPADPPYAPPYSQPSYKQGRPYSFRYGVKDDYAGADYGQDETSDGHLVKGSYFVALPDGRLQTVKYQADHVIGYVADVEFDGDAQHPIAQYGGPITFKPSSRPS
ncbi:cuticle protein 7-like [Homarus americanus]|uniref:cuticle protein 7-like n=1 Tax=Homarus americanus TaxID=6706 RepID=UPI001C481392|nr:cuticle protein 7-like [Homarus americanus]